LTDEWIIIVPPLPQAEADQDLEKWKRGHKVRPEDLRRDQILTGPGQACLVRYLARHFVRL
jgi:hypothetical protein